MGFRRKLEDWWVENIDPSHGYARDAERRQNLLSEIQFDDTIRARDAQRNLLSGQYDYKPSGIERQIFSPGSSGLDENGVFFDQPRPEDIAAKRRALVDINPQLEIDAEVSRLFPESAKPIPVGAKERLVKRNPTGGYDTVLDAVSEASAFKRTNMRLPGTDKVILARTQADYDSAADGGYVESGDSVPGAPSPKDPKPLANDYEIDPNNPAARRMVPGGSAAVSRAEALSKPVLDDRKIYNEAANQYGAMADLANDDTGASDIAMVYTFFKVQDPPSTVREGEFDTVGAKMGLSNRIIGQMKSAASGKGFLTPDVRLALLDTAGRSLKQRKGSLRRSYNDTSKALAPLGVDRKAFLPFSVSDVNITDVRKQFPDAKEDTAGRVYVLKKGKRVYIEVDD